jgi:PadR family transcriptional regulator PadR
MAEDEDRTFDEATLRKFQKELNSGALSLVLLALLEHAPEPMYGYQISKRLEQIAGGATLVKQGTLYPLLRAMEAQGLLASEVEPSIAGPPRRYYAITGHGRRTLPAWGGAWRQTRDFVEAVLARAGASAGAQHDPAAERPSGGDHE